MNQGRTVFSQLVEFLPTYQFQICVDRYQGNRYVKDFSCWDQFLCLAFAQLTYRESLRDIEACLRAQQPKLYHMGFRGQEHVGTRQRTPRLADLRRFRPSLDCRRSRPLPWRIFWSGTVRDRVCPRLDDHRFVSVAFPLGKISPPQERGETAHAAGSAGQHSDQCLCDRRPSSRREHFGPVASRSRSVLLARSRLCGLRSPVCLGPSLCLLRHSR